MLLKPARREYHLRAAGWLVARAGERVDEFSATIANHFELAGNLVRAGSWYARAAHLARSAYNLQAATEYYHKALNFLSNLSGPLERYTLYEGLGGVLRLQARLDEAEQVLQKMSALAEELGDWTRQANAQNALWGVLSPQARYEEALEVSRRAIALARRAENPDLAIQAQAIFQVGILEYRLDDLDEAERCGLESLALSQRAGAKAQIASSDNLLAIIYTLRGLYQRAIVYFQDGLELWREIRHREHEAALLSNLGECYRMLGDARLALDHYQQADRIASDIGDNLNRVSFLNNMCAAYNLLGDYPLALRSIQGALEDISADSFNAAEVHYDAAETYLGLGDFALAARHAREAVRLAAGFIVPEMIGHAWRVAGRVASASGGSIRLDWQAGEADFLADNCFEKAVETFAAARMERHQGVALWEWARHAALVGDHQRSNQLYDSARVFFVKCELDLLLETMEKERLAWF